MSISTLGAACEAFRSSLDDISSVLDDLESRLVDLESECETAATAIQESMARQNTEKLSAIYRQMENGEFQAAADSIWLQLLYLGYNTRQVTVPIARPSIETLDDLRNLLKETA